MTTEVKTMIGVLVACVIIIAGGAWLYQRSIPSENLSADKMAILIRDNSVKKVAPNQKLVVVEYGDYECPACKFMEPTVKELMDTYKDNVTFVFRTLPIHQHSVQATQAVMLAGDQGKYWEMGDLLFTTQADWESLADPTDAFVAYAGSLGLSTTTMKADIQSGKYADFVERDRQDAGTLGVNSTPTFFIGDKILRSADPAALKQAIADALK